MARREKVVPPRGRKKVPSRAKRLPQKTRTSELKDTAADVAYQQIKRKIRAREYAPGQFMHEMAICAELELGRTPVHQALHRLQLERLVSIIPRKGIMVDPVSPSDIMTVLEVRELLEPYCAAQAARHLTPALIDDLHVVLQKSKKAISEQDLMQFMAADRQFHELLIRTAGNDLIIDFLHSLHGRVARIWRAPSWSHTDFDKTYAEHSRVVDAVCRGDQADANAAMRDHIVSLRVRVMKQFFSMDDSGRLPEIREQPAIAANEPT